MKLVTVQGVGMHSGLAVSVALSAQPGPSTLGAGAGRVPIGHLPVASADRSTTVAVGERLVSTVEHLFAACAALGLHDGLHVEVDGHELPLLDGGSRRWVDVLRDLAIVATASPLAVRAAGVVRVGESEYTFAPGPMQLAVHVDYDDPRLASEASWSGGAEDFRERIALARTFGFVRDLGELAQRGLARSVAPDSVILVSPDGVLCAGRPFEADEPARHKLLDLTGDLFLYGGPPHGTLRATRPGHAATHEAMRIAFERGLVGRA